MRTFRLIQLVFTFISVAFVANAQVSLGVKAGANFADTRINGLIDNLLPEQTIYTGFTAGIVAEIPMINGFSFRPELNYIQKGFISQKDLYNFELIGIEIPLGAKLKTRFNYIEMPLLLKFSTGSELAKFYVIAGPNVSFAVNAHSRPVANFLLSFNLPKVNINLSNDIYERWELSGTLGAGGEFKVGHGKLFGDVRYTHGFTNMLDNPIIDFKAKNQGFNMSAGYAYVF